jgi:hypothetical protein
VLTELGLHHHLAWQAAAHKSSEGVWGGAAWFEAKHDAAAATLLVRTIAG